MCKFYAELKHNGSVVSCKDFENEYFDFKYDEKKGSIKATLTAKKDFENKQENK